MFLTGLEYFQEQMKIILRTLKDLEMFLKSSRTSVGQFQNSRKMILSDIFFFYIDIYNL